MLSYKARMFLFLIKHAHWFQLQLKRKPFDASPEGIAKFRKRVDNPSGLFGKMPKGIVVEPIQIDNLDAEWMRPEGITTKKNILYFHGGMYVCGSPKGHRSHVAKFVKGSKANALVFDYRLAPEHPFPAGLNDAVSAYNYLLDQGVSPQSIVFVGDSAGGGLCLAALLALKEKGLPLPAGAVALSPWTDLTLSGASHQINEAVCLSPIGCAQACSRFYAGEQDSSNPLISPLFGDLSGLPPIRIYVGSDEILLDDSVRYAEKAEQSGVDIHLTVGDGLFHCYPVCAPAFPEATQAMEEILDFISSVTH